VGGVDYTQQKGATWKGTQNDNSPGAPPQKLDGTGDLVFKDVLTNDDSEGGVLHGIYSLAEVAKVAARFSSRESAR
jgi:hypothetical protein